MPIYTIFYVIQFCFSETTVSTNVIPHTYHLLPNKSRNNGSKSIRKTLNRFNPFTDDELSRVYRKFCIKTPCFSIFLLKFLKFSFVAISHIFA